MWKRRARLTAIIAGAAVAAAAFILVHLWNSRPALDDIDWSQPVLTADSATDTDTVTVTWLGVTTLLFDDGETQILIDGFISRPSLGDIVFGRPVSNDAATINYVLDEYRMRRLAAIIPLHSHFDHAMDIGAIANRTSASVIGSASTVQIARGAGVPDDQITLVEAAANYEFGRFNVMLMPSTHAPIGWSGSVPMEGKIDEPLIMPQPVSAWREGGSYIVVINHPLGNAIVQGTAGFTDTETAGGGLSADVVFLGVGGLGTLGRDYAEQYWQTLVTATGASRVYAVHFDDFTKPFGEIEPAPRSVSDLQVTADWFESFRDRWDTDVELILPEFGVPMAIYAQPPIDDQSAERLAVE
ncbi:MAG: MBL fold metallo-hydrolase [Gammaproteobacteria bacterium]|nr:MBL fold metallo-hydrolase [Gammaproteobacteria bacterium]